MAHTSGQINNMLFSKNYHNAKQSMTSTRYYARSSSLLGRRSNIQLLGASNTVLTLGRNMISLITNEACFVMKSVHIRQCKAQIMVET